MIDLHHIDATHTPCGFITPAPASASPPASPPAPQPEKKPYSIHVPLLVSTKEVVHLAGDPQAMINQIVERMNFGVNVILPDGQTAAMHAMPCTIEKSQEDISIPVALCCRIGPKVKVSDPYQFAKGLIESINLAIEQYGCAISLLQPQIITAAPQSLPDPI